MQESYGSKEENGSKKQSLVYLEVNVIKRRITN